MRERPRMRGWTNGHEQTWRGRSSSQLSRRGGPLNGPGEGGPVAMGLRGRTGSNGPGEGGPVAMDLERAVTSRDVTADAALTAHIPALTADTTLAAYASLNYTEREGN